MYAVPFPPVGGKGTAYILNPEKSRHFYNTALAPLGYTMLVEIPKEYTDGTVVLGYGIAPKPDFWIAEVTPNTPKVHIAFRAENHNQVD